MPLRLGPRTFGDDELVVMAVINRTPDSFYAAGRTFGLDAAIDAVDRAVAEGAGIVDVGGVKAVRRGPVVDAAEELRRVLPVVAAARARHPGVAISVDTGRPEVARAALAEGADLVNDTWGGVEVGLAAAAAAGGAGYVCAHAGGSAHRVRYDDVVAEVTGAVTRLAERAVAQGVRPDGILIDPTHDFGKNTRHSLELTRRLDVLVGTGWPVLVALSRKDFLGETLDLPAEERLEATLAASAVAAWLGARVFRAHDVAATRRALDTVATIRGTRQPAVARRGLV